MCGIAGIYNFDGEPASEEQLRSMTDRLRHRGPDSTGVWSEDNIALGHRRLAIRDLSMAGAQPFHSACGQIVVVYNGEIYNDQTVSEELARKCGFVRRTSCDTEIIPECYLQWGPSFVDKLEGIFAIALYDRRDGTLLLARDGNGTKPLYIKEWPGNIQFASEVKAFFADTNFKPDFNPVELSHLLTLGYVSPSASLLKGVRQLPAGTYMVAKPGERSEYRFWQPKRSPDSARSLDANVEQVIETLREVVRDQIVSDVPLAVLQSGGIDSTLISACLPKDHDVHLFSVRFSDSSHNESHLASLIADRLKRPISFIDLGQENLVEDFRAMIDAVDGALADSSALASFQLSRAVRQHASVALSGDGADEYYGGYPTYRTSALVKMFGHMPLRGLAKYAGSIATALSGQSDKRIGKGELFVRLMDGLSSQTPHASWRRYLREADAPALVKYEIGDVGRGALANYTKAGNDGEDVWEQGLLSDQRYYLPADMLVKTDRTSMYHSLEVRVPFLDRRMCDLAANIDRKQLVDVRGRTKIVLRHAAKQLGLPDEVYSARKMGFNLPMNKLLQEDLRTHAEWLLERNSDILEPYLSSDGVRQIWREHREGKRDYRFVVWSLLVLATYKEDCLCH